MLPLDVRDDLWLNRDMETNERTVTLNITSNPVIAAGGLRMMARHLLAHIDPKSAHPDRLRQVADDAEALLVDAVRLCGEDQHDRQLWRDINARRDAAGAVPHAKGRDNSFVQCEHGIGGPHQHGQGICNGPR